MADLEVAVENCLKYFNVVTIKPEQQRILDAILTYKDCMAVLPTGFGKSLPYQLLIPVKKELGQNDGKKVIICSPLIALMKDQCERLSQIPGVKAVYLGGGCRDPAVERGEFDYLFAAPEMLVGDQHWRSVCQKFKVSTIVIDEFHTIATWGEDEGGKKAFRKWFSYIGEMRSLYPEASVLALSATCTQKISSRVKKILNFSTNIIEICVSPNKENIKIVVQKIPNSTEMALGWIIEGLHDGTFPRTLIYCMSIKDSSNIYMYIKNEQLECTCIDMFHSETDDKKKSKIMEALKDPSSELKIVVATSALGMGVDLVGFYNVILYGCPISIVDLVQEIGRVGRDGQCSTALLLHNSYHMIGVEKEVKEVYKAGKSTSNTTNTINYSCRRVAMLAPFHKATELSQLKEVEPVHSCCDLCYSICQCVSCSQTRIEKLFHFTLEDLSAEEEEEETDECTESYASSDNEDIDNLLLDINLD